MLYSHNATTPAPCHTGSASPTAAPAPTPPPSPLTSWSVPATPDLTSDRSVTRPPRPWIGMVPPSWCGPTTQPSWRRSGPRCASSATSYCSPATGHRSRTTTSVLIVKLGSSTARRCATLGISRIRLPSLGRQHLQLRYPGYGH